MSTNILAKIVASKFVEVAERKKQISIGELEAMPLFAKEGNSLKLNLVDPNKTGIIPEFKRQSPSKGIINNTALVHEVTKAYSDFGASGISVLTDTHFFGGSLDDLTIAIKNTTPVLRKEFIIDEFQIYDIADASIIERLFTILFEEGTIIISTSNLKPTKLYADGLHRDRFIPFISFLENDCLVINIDNGKDYRKNRVIDGETYFSPLNDASKESISAMFKKLSNGLPYAEKTLFIKGRELKIEKQALGCARFNFEDLCGKPLGAEDFLSIAKEFDFIFIL